MFGVMPKFSKVSFRTMALFSRCSCRGGRRYFVLLPVPLLMLAVVPLRGLS